MGMKWNVFALLTIGLLGGRTTAQQGQTNVLGFGGSPFIRNYAPDEYGAHNQNWAIAQDARGVIYFGNNHGLLEYDGVSWRLIPTENRSIVRSLCVGPEHQIFVGGFGEIGYLAADANGNLHYASLKSHLDVSYRDFSDVWQTLKVGQDIYFVTHKYLFRWDGRRMHVWPATTSFHIGYEVYDRFYVRQRSIGLMYMRGDSLLMAPLGERFAEERIGAMLPYPAGDKGSILLAMRSKGLMIYNGKGITPLPTQADKLLSTGQIYHAALLPDNTFAFGTLQEGIVVVDAQGRLLHHLTKATGLNDDNVWYVYPDRHGGLWAGLHVGISRVEIPAVHTFFGEREGVEGSVLEVIRHQGRLYLATSMGVYYLDESPAASRVPGRFRRVSGVSPQAWALLPFGETLLAGVFDGLYAIQGHEARLLYPAYVMSLCRSKVDSNRVFLGLQAGLLALYYDNGRWRDEGLVKGIDQEIRHIHETPEGALWLTALQNGLIKVDYTAGFSASPSIVRYDTLHGLPGMERNSAFQTSKGLRFATAQGVYCWNAAEQRFVPDTGIVRNLPYRQAQLFTINADPKGNLWMVANEKTPSGLAVLQSDGQYLWQSAPFQRLKGMNAYYAYPDPSIPHITWIGCMDRVVRYQVPQTATPKPECLTLIRQITANGDTVVYGGAGVQKALSLKYAFNSLRFRYATPCFDEPGKTLYQYKLEGYDKAWSDWTTETYKDYTRLPQGAYRFLVRSIDMYEAPSQPAEFSFRILPPFYLSPWAFALYMLALGGLVYATWQYQLQRIRRQHQQAIEHLEYEKLRELDQLKSRFFADISHEFRTPLTLIMGPLEKLITEEKQPARLNVYHAIQHNAQQLLNLINQLLDLSRLEAGKLKLQLVRTDLIPLLKGLTYSFESLVASRGISLAFETHTPHAWTDCDYNKMEQIFSNLISNAVKFTPTGGEVKVEVHLTDEDRCLQVDVSDTGPGIPEAQQPHIFDRFYQGDAAQYTTTAGSGIGLALTKELVELHSGQITLHSTPGEGARFRVVLPAALAPIAHVTKVKPTQPLYATTAREVPVVHAASEQPLLNLEAENTLLLVEDNPEMRIFIRDILSPQFNVLEATNGQDGLEKALAYIPDLIVSDVMMPIMDGLQLCETLKKDERSSHIPIILLTAKADVESRIAGLKRGADDYLAKPFSREELLVRAGNLMNLRRQLQAYFATPTSQPPPPETPPDENLQIEDAFLQKIRNLVIARIQESDLDIDQLARLAGMSRSQLFRKIKALTGLSPSLFIRSCRLSEARKLLRETDMNVSEVAYTVGFSTPAFFSDTFFEAFGVRPSQFRKDGRQPHT